MWRIHFTADDLARTRVTPSLGPLAETLFGLVSARAPWPTPLALLGWRDRARQLFSPAMRPLADLYPRRTFGLDLWTLTGEALTIEQGLAALRGMRPRAVQLELDGFRAFGALPAQCSHLADRDGAARRQLADAAATTYRALIEPYWNRAAVYLQTQRLAYANCLLDGGIERLFARLAPAVIRWSAPTLEVRAHTDADVYLEGRGLLLVPSVFLGDMPLLLMDQSQPTPPRLVVPTLRPESATLVLHDDDSLDALAQLIGHTRARVLAAVEGGCATTDLARRAYISLPAASQHAAVLRRAGLVSTHREGKGVRHTLTPLGSTLLAQVGSSVVVSR